MVGEVERVVSADGISIAYRRVGRGPRVIAVRGGLGTWRSWLGVARQFADRFELVLVERRGRGDSPDGGARYAFAREVEDLAAVRDQRVGQHQPRVRLAMVDVLDDLHLRAGEDPVGVANSWLELAGGQVAAPIKSYCSAGPT